MRLIKIAAVLYLHAIFISSAAAESGFWGVNSWGFVSFTTAVVLGILLVPLLRAKSADRAARGLTARIHSRTVRLLAAGALSLLVFWLLRARHDLWGDRAIAAAALDHSAMGVRTGSPLSSLIHVAFFRLVNPAFLWTGATATAALSILTGALYAVTACVLAELLFEGDEDRRSLAFFILLCSGYIVVFFGAGGSAPLAVLFAGLFIATSLLHLKGRAHLFVPPLLFLTALFAHISNVYLLPALIYLLAAGSGRRERRLRMLITAGGLALCWVVLDRVFAGMTGGSGTTGFLLRLVSARLYSLRTPGHLAAHLMNALNGFLLLGPATLFALLLLFGLFRPVKEPAGGVSAGDAGTGSPAGEIAGAPRNGTDPTGAGARTGTFLALLALPAVLLFFVGGTVMKGGFRWELFASTGPALAAFCSYALGARTPDLSAFRRSAVLMVGIGIFHTLPWIIINISSETAEQRLLELPIPPGRAELILGDRALAHEERSRAAEYFLTATKKDTLNDVAFYRLGMIEMEEEEYVDAISHLYRAYELQPANTQYQYQLAEAYIAKRWFTEAITELEDLTDHYPMNGRYWQRLGFARNHSNRYAEAITAYERALSLDPDDVQNVKNLTSAVLNRAAELQMAGDLEGARKLYHQAKALYPDDWRATNNLIVMEIREGNIEQAHRMLIQALKEHPFAPNLNYNMGTVLEEMGKDREALEYYRKAAALDPLRSPAQNDILRIEKKLMLEKEKKTP